MTFVYVSRTRYAGALTLSVCVCIGFPMTPSDVACVSVVYLPSCCYRFFNTAVDIKLKQWADKLLPRKCVEVSLLVCSSVFYDINLLQCLIVRQYVYILKICL